LDQLRSLDDLQRLSTSSENAVAILDAVGDIDVSHLLPRIAARTLVLHCRDDAAQPIGLGLMLARDIPDARFVELPSRNHFPVPGEGAWPDYISRLRSFIAEIKASDTNAVSV
jgi:pimeloyl-ACP methyl ester carboxylesterase